MGSLLIIHLWIQQSSSLQIIGTFILMYVTAAVCQQAPYNHHVHVHVPTSCINLRFVCIICPFVLNRYFGIAREFLCLKRANYFCLLSPNRGLSKQFFYLFVAYFARVQLILNGLMNLWSHCVWHWIHFAPNRCWLQQYCFVWLLHLWLGHH